MGRYYYEKILDIIMVGETVKNTEAFIAKIEKRSHILIHVFPLAIHLIAFEAIPHLKTKVPGVEDENMFTEYATMHIKLLKTFHTAFID